MFTQCSKCETVFRLSAEVLRAAGGQVRCGRCGEVFNALQRLAEDAAAFSPGESSYELENRADAILNSPAAVEPVEPEVDEEPDSDVEIARLQIVDPPVDEELSAETSLEFTLPPGELDRIFIESRRGKLQRFEIPARRADDPHPPAPPTPAASPATPAGPPIPAPPPPPAAPMPAPAAAAAPIADFEGLNPPRRWLPLLLWSGLAVLLTLLLAVQLYLGSHTGEAALRTKLAAYQLRQWGVTGDPGIKDTLRVRASIMNVSTELQPYPLLRVTLANRFGTPVGQRQFEPAEYLGKPTVEMLTPGRQLDATLDLVDPGKDAEGFEIDICARGADRQVLCSGDDTAQSR